MGLLFQLTTSSIIFHQKTGWVPDRGHNDICEGQAHMNQYIRRLKAFLESLNHEESSNTKP